MKKQEKQEGVLVGSISISSKGVGYFRLPESERDEAIEVQSEYLNKALPGDTVEIVKRPELFYGRVQGQVVKVLERAKENYVGTVFNNGKNIFVKADDGRVYVDFFIKPEDKFSNIKTNTKVLIKFLGWNDGFKNPQGQILKIIGQKGEHNAEMKSILFESGFEDEFPKEVLKEADGLKIESEKPEVKAMEISKRRDMRDVLTFTIDPKDAKDFDDALSIQDLGDNLYEIGIHIADVSHFVRPNTALDKEALKRSLSVYLVDRTIPMLPEVLSNDLCSLNPNEDKYTFSSVFKIDISGKIHDKWFGKTIIHSDKRFTYEEAQEILDNGNGLHFKELEVLRKIGKILEKEKFEKGAINFETDEVKFELDQNGKPIRVYRKIRGDTHRLIEEFMLLSNREVAEFIYKKQNVGGGKSKGHSVYRIHETPDKDKINELSIFLKALGYDLKHKDGEVSTKDISSLLEKIEGSANEELIKTATIRSMAKAIYSTKNIGHFGLGFQFYTHFTSPIRRYPDLLVHRLLERELTSGKVSTDEFAFFENICMKCSEQEKKAADAERGSIKYKQVEYMKDRIGQVFEGKITGVIDWGIYIEEKETKCEGMMKMKDVGNVFGDFFGFNPKNYSVVGQKTGKKFTLGDSVKFKVIGADLEKKTLDYQII